MGILLGVDEGKGGGGALPEQDSLACFLGQRTGKGVSVAEPPEAFLELLNEFIDMKGPAFFSQYLNGEVNERLTSSPLAAYEDGVGLGLSLELPNSAQLIVELELKDLKQNFFDILFSH
jgi:hypothetical protein